MIADLKPYAEYKESGLTWLGRVPGHWETRRLRASITDCVNGLWGAEPNGEEDLICVRVADFDRIGLRVSLRKKTVRAIPISARSRRLLRRGDLLLEKSGGGELQPVGAVVAYDHDEPAVCSNFVARMPIAPGYDPFFVNYLHCTLYANRVNIRSIKQTTGIQNLDGKAYLSELVVFPPPAEQAAIVRFLDWASGRLERAIRAKRKVIALLNEQKQAIIHRAVTRGLDPSVPLKPSGIPWLGDIPAHWEVTKLKHISPQITVGIVIQPARLYVPRGVPALRSLNISSGSITTDELVQISEHGHLANRKSRLTEGDVVAVRTGRTGVAVVVPAELDGANCIDLLIIRRSRRLLSEYLLVYFRSYGAKEDIAFNSVGAIQAHYNTGTLANLRIPLPSVSEQHQILTACHGQLAPIDSAISRLEREIALLREYRTRLVADVVTGKIDVRDAAARLPDEAPLPDATSEGELDDLSDDLPGDEEGVE